jgi:aryl-alcohol dehydrogenase-like predicted oxidoreductase
MFEILQTPKIILGTANFGNEYGIANKNQNSRNESGSISKIIQTALNLGITSFDTAKGYGDAERILGDNLDGYRKLSVTTKIGKNDCEKSSQIISSVQESLESIKLKQFSAVLLHDSSVLGGENRNEVIKGLLELLSLGICERIGVSVYSESEVVWAKKILPELTEFQIPENICDQRKIFSGYLHELANTGNNISVRSIFLQGLLLMEVGEIPSNLNSATEKIMKLQEFAHINQITVLEACIAYARSIPWASGLIFGVDNLKQLRTIVSNFNKSHDLGINTGLKLDDWTLDPRNWS